MDNILINAPAKVNLYLSVLGKRSDGYHDLQMIMQTVDLYDKVSISKIEKGIYVECKSPYIPKTEKNLAYKAAKMMIEHFNIQQGVLIKIDKKIPISAGLAGGSADAAAVINGMNKIFNLGVDIRELALLGKKVGADVPFCIIGGTAIAEGIGEVLTPITSLIGVTMVLVKPSFSVSTANVFSSYENDKNENKPDINTLKKCIEKSDINGISNNLYNDLERVTAEKFSIIKEIKDMLMKNGAIGCLMSGSGPSVYGIFDTDNKAENAYYYLKNNNFKEVFKVKTCC